MNTRTLIVPLVLTAFAWSAAGRTELFPTGRLLAQEKRKTGALAGIVTAKGESKSMNNAWVEIKADGEEKARRYWPAGDPKVGGPVREILAALRAVTIGSRVRAEWIDAGDGKDLTKFEVLKAAPAK